MIFWIIFEIWSLLHIITIWHVLTNLAIFIINLIK